MATSCSRRTLDRRHRAEEPPGVRVLGRREDLARRAVLHLPACVHHEHGVGRLRDDAEVVRDEDHAHVELLLDPLDELEDLRLHGDVERGRRLIGDQHRRPVHERHRDHRALAHAAGELVREVARPLVRLRDADRVAATRPPALPASDLRDVRVRETASAIWSPTRCIGWRHGERVLEDHRDVLAADDRASRRAAARARCARGRLGFPGDRALGGLSSPISARLETVLPDPTRPRCRASRPGAACRTGPTPPGRRPHASGTTTVRSRTSRTYLAHSYRTRGSRNA